MQCFYGCSACSSTSDDDQKIFTPGKMPCPPLAARVKQRYMASSLRIDSMGFGVLVAVAGRARPRQFGQRIPGTTYAWQDMFTDKWCRRVAGRMLTIFTAVMRTCTHLLSKSAWNGSTCHSHYAPRQCPASPPARVVPGAGLMLPTPQYGSR